MSVPKITLDVRASSLEELKAALGELEAVLSEPLPAPVMESLEQLFSLPDFEQELVSIESDSTPTGAGEFTVGLYPSNLLRMLPTAIRAGKVEDLLIEKGHINSPQG